MTSGGAPSTVARLPALWWLWGLSVVSSAELHLPWTSWAVLPEAWALQTPVKGLSLSVDKSMSPPPEWPWDRLTPWYLQMEVNQQAVSAYLLLSGGPRADQASQRTI